MKATIAEALRRALERVGVSDAVVELEHPAELKNGDYATGTALRYAKAAGTNPRALAEKLVAEVGPIEGVEKVEIAGPGFINFFLAKAAFAKAIDRARESEAWGKNASLDGKKVMVEYTDPNPFKEFHIGHLMSNAIGESVARLIEMSGARVVRANWQGDVGQHVAKAIWGKMQQPELSWGAAYTYGSEHYEAHKEAIDTINKQVYDHTDPAINELYERGRRESLEHFEAIYKILGTKFDFYFFEGIEGMEGPKIVREFLEKGVFAESDGAVIFPGEKYGLHTRVFLTSKGLPTYEAKELGLNRAKFEKVPDLNESIIVTASEQSDYFKVVLKAMEFVMPKVAEKTTHVAHGMMRFAEGKMSSRKGNVITGESLIEDLTEAAQARARESRAADPEGLAQSIAVAAIKYQILKQGAGKDIIFDRERALSLEGDSGPYLQYAHARAAGVMERARSEGIEAKLDPNAEATDLVRTLHRFPDALAYAAEKLEPHLLVNHLIELASAFNSWYAQVHILDGSSEAPHKLAIVDAVRATLEKGLWTLGIPAPQQM